MKNKVFLEINIKYIQLCVYTILFVGTQNMFANVQQNNNKSSKRLKRWYYVSME